MTIDQSVYAVAVLFLVATVLFFVLGRRRLIEARRLPYFMLRQERMSQSWRVLLLAVVLGLAALLTFLLGPRAVYIIYPPTPSTTPTLTPSPTPSITPIPSITATPTVTQLPSITPTSTITPTPQLPEEIKILLRESTTPNPDALFSPILVSPRLNRFNQAIDPQEDFIAPQGRLLGAFSYDNLQDGVRWTAIWYHQGEIFCLESLAWDGGTGGFGYTECDGEWLPGRYEIQIFYAERWQVSTEFEVLNPTPTG